MVPPAVISPKVDTLFIEIIDDSSSLSCFVSKDVLRLTPPLVILSHVKFLNVKFDADVNIPCFVSKSACVIPPPPVEEIVLLVIVIFSPAIKVFCFVFKAVSTYNFEVKCVVKVGVVFLTNTNPLLSHH